MDEETIVDGYVSGGKIYLPKSASVAGMLYAKEGISITSASIIEAEERIKRFEQNFDIIEEVNRILE